MHATTSKTDDHRPRVAAKRRQRMRQRLVEAAMLVLAEKGGGAGAIDEVAAVAHVSRGTFYNYFRTSDELVAAIGEQLSNELVQRIESRVAAVTDPVERISQGLRLYLDTARTYTHFARFLCMTGLGGISRDNLILEYVPRHLAEAMESARLPQMAIDVAMDLIAGSAMAAVFRLAYDAPPVSHVDALVGRTLAGLGVPLAEALALASTPLQPLVMGEDSLLVRTQVQYLAESTRSNAQRQDSVEL